ncbi:MAG: 5'/3'-nucleotidase SurE [Acidimicrobiales bacterium]
MHILVTNDDGVFAPGIASLAATLAEAGHDVVVVAPLEDQSGSSAATGVQPQSSADALALEAVELERATGVRAYGIASLPAACVAIALGGALGPPAELVVSGINRGRNIGRLILHSGTVGAAFTASKFGRSALAISIKSDGKAPVHFATAAEIAAALIEPLASMEPGSVLNCNVPNKPLDEIRGVRRAYLSESDIFHSTSIDAGRIRVSLGYRGQSRRPDDDEALTSAGFVSLTALSPPREDSDPKVQARVDELADNLDGRFGADRRD